MSEDRTMESFERRLADRAQAYTDPAVARRVDPLEIARTAMGARSVTTWSVRPPGSGLLGRPFAVMAWALAAVAVVVVGVVGSGIQRRPTETPSGPIAEVLRHAWQRPLPVAPEPIYATAYLNLTATELGVGPEPDAASRSAIGAAGLDTVVITATAATAGCTIGDVGSYRWTMEGKGTFLTLTATSPDACAAREKALTGPWVRADLPPGPALGVMLKPGVHVTSTFNPFGDLAGPGRLSFTVPEGWILEEDSATVFVLHQPPDTAPGPSRDTLVVVFTGPRMVAEFADGADCGAANDAPGIGTDVADLVPPIRARPGVVSTAPEALTIDGHAGQMLDLELAPAWTRGCRSPQGLVVGVPIVRQGGPAQGPGVGVQTNQPVRLYLMDFGDGRTLAIAAFMLGPVERSRFDEQMTQVAPIVQSFEFLPTGP
jgi:hypothetical protein